MRRWSRILIMILVLGALVAGVAFVRWRGDAVATVQPHRGPITQTVVSSGRVLSPAEIKLGSLIASTVKQVHVDEGDVVTAGQLLLQLDEGDARAAVEQARASVTQARAGRYELAKLSGPAAAAALRQAQAQLDQAKRRLDREERLFAGGVVTEASLEEAHTAVSVATSQHEAAKLQVEAAGAGGSQAVLAAAGIAVAEAQLARARVQLARTRVEAPADGVVVAREVEPGDAVVAGSRLFVLSREGATRLVIEPDERNLALLAIGQPATASTEAFPQERFEAEVAFIAPSVDAQRGTVEVRLAVPEPPDYLRPHMTVSVEIEVGRQDDGLLVPRSALRGLATERPYALVVTAQRVERRPVQLGLRGAEHVEVTEGLAATDTLIVDETAQVEAGDRVRPRPE